MRDDLSAGAAIALAETEQRMLSDPGEIWRVTEGYLLVYVALSDAFGLAGPPRYVATCRTGQLVFGGETSDASGLSATILAVAGKRAALEPVRIATAGIDELSDWALTLCRHLGERGAAGPVQTSELRDVVTAAPGGAFRSRSSELAMVRLVRGTAALGGFDAAAWRPEDGPVAVNDTAWFVGGAEGAEVVLGSVGDSAPALAEACRVTTRLWLVATFEVLRVERAQEKHQLAEVGARREGERQRAVDALRFMDEGTVRLGPRPDDPLAGALDLIGAELGLDFDTGPLADDRRPLPERLARVAELSGARARRVKLTGPWIEGDAGVILALTGDGAPRVFLPRARRLNMKLDYEIVFPDSGARRRARPADLDDLDENGYVFIAGFPDVLDAEGRVDHWRVAKFAITPELRDMRQVMLLMLVGMVLGMLTPIGHFIIVDKVIPNDERELLVGIGIAVAVITLCTFAFGMAQAFVSLRVQTRIFARMQASIIDRMMRLPNRFFRTAPTGELLKRALMVSDISVGMISALSGAISAVLGILIMVALCFYYSPRLAWLALIVALVSAAITVTSSYLMRRRTIEMQLIGGRILGFLMQIIQGASKLQTARAEERAFTGWARATGEGLRLAYANARLQHTASMLGMVVTTVATMALFYIAGRMVQQSEVERALNPLAAPLLTIGVFFAFQRSFTSVGGFVTQFFSAFVEAHMQMVKRDLVRPFLETPLEQTRAQIDPGPLQGRIEMRNVTFRYNETMPLALDGVNIDVHDGEFVAIVGPSGAGKSTIVALLLGFEKPQAGTVLIDGRPLDTLDMGAVRRQIGVVLQQDRIGGGSLYQAIAGASAITLDQAWQAARDAGLEPDIKAMPMGMHSLVPEGGGTFSGGQRQRLSIARALAQNPRIMLFDEATSALDNRSQAIVSESLKRRRVTRIVIAHRLSTIAGADRVFVLSRGRVVETGAPEALLAAGGLFARLAQNQEA